MYACMYLIHICNHLYSAFQILADVWFLLCMYVHTRAYICVCVCVPIYACIHTYTHTHIRVHTSTHTLVLLVIYMCGGTCVHVYMHRYVYVHDHSSTYMHICVCIYIYICIQKTSHNEWKKHYYQPGRMPTLGRRYGNWFNVSTASWICLLASWVRAPAALASLRHSCIAFWSWE